MPRGRLKLVCEVTQGSPRDDRHNRERFAEIPPVRCGSPTEEIRGVSPYSEWMQHGMYITDAIDCFAQ